MRMRTTLQIDDDILAAAKELARRENKTAGKVISELARKGIHVHGGKASRRYTRNGFEVIPADGRIITPELVQKILEESGEA
jgi:hypothetical protein